MSDHPKKAVDSINTFGVAVIGVVATFLVWASVVALQAYFYKTNDEFEHAREVDGQGVQARLIRAEQEGQLNPEKVETIDPRKGTVRVPIDYAMGKVVETLNGNPTGSVVPMVGAHDTPTVPAVWGRPADNAKVPTPEDTVPGAPGDETGAATGDDAATPPAGAPALRAAPAPAPKPAPKPAAPAPKPAAPAPKPAPKPAAPAPKPAAPAPKPAPKPAAPAPKPAQPAPGGTP